MSEIDEKVEEVKKPVEAIDFVEIGRNALAVVGGVAIVGGAAFLIAKGVNASKAAKVVVENAPEIAANVAEAAEVVL